MTSAVRESYRDKFVEFRKGTKFDDYTLSYKSDYNILIVINFFG